MKFEFDPVKSATTKADPNRRIDFVEAQALWKDPNLIEIPLPFSDEPRAAVIGRIGRKIWTAIITRRPLAARIASVRRAHPKEVTLYEKI